MNRRILTGITTTGTPHLGNYAGAIRPAIAASAAPDVESFFFLADYHGLIKCHDPTRIARSRIEVAAAWLAAGLDSERVFFYRQSDVPETLELNWLLTCVTSKGLMNRAHAYKAATEERNALGEELDAGITMGLYSYPILMAADILLFGAHQVPVGRDQIQHIEMTRDLAKRFNQLFAGGAELLTLPEAMVGEQPLLPGLDGRKMSKSYDNTLPLFEGGHAGLKAGVAKIVTDSRRPGEPKDPDSNAIAALYAAFSSAEQASVFRAELMDGLGWGEAKTRLVGQIESELGPMRSRYQDLIGDAKQLEEILQVGAHKARARARPLLEALRDAVGLRDFSHAQSGNPARGGTRSATERQTGRVGLRQYRDSNGQFFFKLLGPDDRTLLIGGPFASGAEAGRAIKALRSATGGVAGEDSLHPSDGLPMEDLLAGLRAWRGEGPAASS